MWGVAWFRADGVKRMYFSASAIQCCFWKPTLLAGIVALCLVGCGRKSASTSTAMLPLEAAIPADFPRQTRLSLGDPMVQKQLELMGEIDKLPFLVEWQNISGGPQTLEAFRAGVLDGGSVGDTPPIHAGLDVKIVAVQIREKPIMRLAAAPGVRLASIQDLRGKRIAYAPGQAQGALVLRILKKANLAKEDVVLVELSSPEFKDALASGQVDVAPLSGPILLRYLRENESKGASAIAHGTRDSLAFFYVRTEVLKSADKAAALRAYIALRTKAQLWAYAHRDTWIDAYYVKDQGLSAEEGRYIFESQGAPQYPGDWTDAIELTEQTIDLLAKASGRPIFDAKQIFDLRFQAVGAEVQRAVQGSRTLPGTSISQGSLP
jgi:sulfonate transport system substrate-binding protein